MNWIVILLTALVPLVTGFIWYNPKVFGNAWMQAADMSPDKMKGANMAMIFGLTFILSIFLAMSMQFLTIHQLALNSIVQNQPNFMDPTSEAGSMVKAFMDKYGTNFRTFKHGAMHGALSSIFIILPVIAINAMFERKSGKYIMINFFYWMLNFIIMGGIICQYA